MEKAKNIWKNEQYFFPKSLSWYVLPIHVETLIWKLLCPEKRCICGIMYFHLSPWIFHKSKSYDRTTLYRGIVFSLSLDFRTSKVTFSWFKELNLRCVSPKSCFSQVLIMPRQMSFPITRMSQNHYSDAVLWQNFSWKPSSDRGCHLWYG